MKGRDGSEHLRPKVTEIMSSQAAWPFHLAGDSGATLFEHRAWLSWRYLALLELPDKSVWQLPLLSTELQSLIENVRRSAQSEERLDSIAVEQILFDFLHDPTDSYAKRHWLRRARKLSQTCEDSAVEERLRLLWLNASQCCKAC